MKIGMHAAAGFLAVFAVLYSEHCALPQVSNDSLKAAHQPPSAAMVIDSRLDRRVDLDYSGVELSELLAKLSGGTPSLKAADECAHQKPQMHLRSRSLREIMDSLSSLISGDWVGAPGGYMLRMKISDIAQRAAWWDLLIRQREEAATVQRELMLTAMRAKPRPPDPNRPSPESGVVEGYRNAVDMASVYGAIPPDLHERIASQVSDYMSYTGFFAGNITESGVAASFGSLPNSVQVAVAGDANPQLSEKSISAGQTSVLFVNCGGCIFLSLIAPDGSQIRTRSMFTGSRPTNESTMLDLDQRWLPKEVERLGNRAPSLWKRLAEFQKRRVWPNDLPVEPSKAWPPLRTGDSLGRLRRLSGIEYLSDLYSVPTRPMKDDERARPVTSLKAELDQIADDSDSSWKRQSPNLFLIRNNRWYRDDPLELPNELPSKLESGVRKFAVDLAGHQARPTPPSLDDIHEQAAWDSDVIGRLNPWQITQGFAWAFTDTVDIRVANTSMQSPPYPFARVADRLMRERHAMQFYGQLPQRLRKELIDGVLRVSELSPEMREGLLFIAPEFQGGGLTDPALSLQPVSETGFVFTRTPAIGNQDSRTALHVCLAHAAN